ncbi:UDP-N-acetylmuramoyl-L-alanyl-D-glutamate--2,6-diaminopimelate ligase [Allorhodopirellula solitaria]|uniref:MurE-like ligase n=1 Tax=Allorhodopirellula solitaria TaxID=2527987 RepID=A0A5C5XAH8_9BACT|nr:UDP-N-acetylmuramoyl-L-alanyl-D-glutamate--2,6-diaminopimelate ligase [Allorhodopirellula solitaria]TWT59185.1 MurE-like ligase [Allorhodopirellula solitaria]
MHHSINRSIDFSSNRDRIGSANFRSGEDGSATAVATQTFPRRVDPSDRVTVASSRQSETAQVPPQDGDTELRSLASLLPKSRFFSGSDVHFHSIAASAQECEAGQLVVYRIGLDCPEELICQALARGAAGILTEQILPVPLPQCIVADTDRAMAEIAALDSIAETGSRPDQRLLTVGIVGDSGKGTTALSLAAILRDIPCRVAYQSDLGQSDGVTEDAPGHAPATGANLMQQLCEAADAGAAVSVFELDANVLRRGGYDEIGLDILVITACVAARSDFGPSPVECALERLRHDGVVVVDSGDRRSLASIREAGLPHLTYGVNTNADVSLHVVDVEDGVLTAMIRHGRNSALMESHLGHGVMAPSLVAATAVGIATDNPLVQIAESLSGLRELPGRCQMIGGDNWETAQANPKMLLDVAGSPQRAEFVLRALDTQTRARSANVISMNARTRSPRAGRAELWCVLAISGNEDDDCLAHYGRLLETMTDHCVLTCVASCKDRFLSLSHSVLDGVENCAAIRLVADQERAIMWAANAANAQDTVVVLGGVDRSSPPAQSQSLQHLQEMMLESQQKPFDDSEPRGSAPMLKLYHPDA